MNLYQSVLVDENRIFEIILLFFSLDAFFQISILSKIFIHLTKLSYDLNHNGIRVYHFSKSFLTIFLFILFCFYWNKTLLISVPFNFPRQFWFFLFLRLIISRPRRSNTPINYAHT